MPVTQTTIPLIPPLPRRTTHVQFPIGAAKMTSDCTTACCAAEAGCQRRWPHGQAR